MSHPRAAGHSLIFSLIVLRRGPIMSREKKQRRRATVLNIHTHHTHIEREWARRSHTPTTIKHSAGCWAPALARRCVRESVRFIDYYFYYNEFRPRRGERGKKSRAQRGWCAWCGVLYVENCRKHKEERYGKCKILALLASKGAAEQTKIHRYK